MVHVHGDVQRRAIRLAILCRWAPAGELGRRARSDHGRRHGGARGDAPQRQPNAYLHLVGADTTALSRPAIALMIFCAVTGSCMSTRALASMPVHLDTWLM